MSKGGNRAGVQGWVAEGPWPLWTKGVPCDVGSGAPVGGGGRTLQWAQGEDTACRKLQTF